MGSKTCFTAAIFLTVFLVVSGFGSPAMAADKVVKIGYTAPFTGSAAEFGANGWRGIQLALEDINKTGIKIGADSYKVEIVRYDSVCNPTEGVANVRKQGMQDKVAAILGDHCSSVCAAIAPLCDEMKIPGLTIECAADKVTSPGNEFYFRMRPSMGLISPLASPPIKKAFNPQGVAFLVVNDDYGKSFADSFKSEMSKLGVKTVAEETFERGNTDFMVYLNKIKNAKADLVFYVGTTPEGAMILRQAQEMGLTKTVKFLGSEEMGEMELLSLAGPEAAEGTYAVALWGAPPADLEKRVTDTFKAPMHYAIIFGYDALKVLAASMEKAQSTDPVKIKDALKAIKYNGLQGQITFETFDKFKNQGRYTPVIVKWEKGKRVVVK